MKNKANKLWLTIYKFDVQSWVVACNKGKIGQNSIIEMNGEQNVSLTMKEMKKKWSKSEISLVLMGVNINPKV